MLEPLSERIPEYLTVFAIGFGMIAALALAGWVFFAFTARFGREVGLVLLRPVFGSGVATPGWGFDAGYLSILGYTLIIVGTALLLVGGSKGGGYTNIGVGAVEAMFGGRNRAHDDFEADSDQRHGAVMKRQDPMARLKRGLRPEANPTAFWQAVAGFSYIAIGLGLLSL